MTETLETTEIKGRLDVRREPLKAGEVIVITSGEYHYYKIEGMLRAEKEFAMPEAMAAFIASHGTEYPEADYGGEDKWPVFVEFMRSHGYATEIKSTEFRIGSYGKLDLTLACKGHEFENSSTRDDGQPLGYTRAVCKHCGRQ